MRSVVAGRPISATPAAAQPQGLHHPKAKRAVLGVAVLLLLAGVSVSLEHHPGLLSELDWRAVALVAALVPVTAALNACEFMLTGRLLGREIGLSAAAQISVIGTAANLLPLPGATLVRVAGLRAAGAGYGEGALATLLVAGIWAGVAFLFAGAWLLGTDATQLGWLLLVLGTALWITAFALAARLCSGLWFPCLITAAKTLLVLVDIARIFLCFRALGVAVGFAPVTAFAVAGVAGSAVSIVPAGLGVRELVSAALAPLVGMAAGIAFLAAALNRLLGLLTIVPIALAMLALGRKRATGREPQT